MSMKITLAAGYLLTTLLGSACPTKLAAVVSLPRAAQHVEMMEIAMTPLVPMTWARPVSLISASPSVPMPFSGNCQTGHCLAGPPNLPPPSLSTVTVQLARNTSPPFLPFPVLVSSIALPAPPDYGNTSLATILSTVVLRV